ncbi:hypothetical protein [uncultured Nostoc sp.]|uniref:hypothetical protein n=1 Tax=uncultured Nostoc sp. TaxID=340711 RepID=UPI0035CC2593
MLKNLSEKVKLNIFPCIGFFVLKCNEIFRQQHQQGYSATFTAENSVSGAEVKADHEGESSGAPVPNAEKWSHEAIVARSNMRPVRREKLNRAANSGENPGFDFLLSCWNDDPALVIMIKKLLAKFPQWGIAIVDGVLLDCER